MLRDANFFASCPKNLEGLLEQELIALGALTTKQTVAGVKFTGDLALAYRICLWSRLANRVLLELATFNAQDAAALYQGIRQIKWLDHLRPNGSFVVDFVGVSAAINNSHFGALKVKDAIVDQIREATGGRPNIDKVNPELRLNVYLYHEIATISLDLSGESLHRRGYRHTPGAAPLKENLAAAILYRSKWPELARQGQPLFDPMCGSGTILIEAAMMAQDYAPGLLRKSFGFSRWLGHERGVWQKLWYEAKERRLIGKQKAHSIIYGSDIDPQAIERAKLHINKAGLEQTVQVTTNAISQIAPLKSSPSQPGIIVTNPPYGKRLHEEARLAEFYQELGAVLRHNFLAWQLAMLTGNPELSKKIGLRPYKQYNFFNGTIPCKLLLFHVVSEMFWHEYKEEALLVT